MILWSNAASFKDSIVQEISEDFDLLYIHSLFWKKNLFKENLKRFYAHSQKHLSEQEYDVIINNKIVHCGDEQFTVIVFDDSFPKFEDRKTSNGINRVNANVFNKKEKFRELTGGGHKIHASDNYFETNKDLSLLFGLNIDGYRKEYEKGQLSEVWHKNIVGVPLWRDLKEFFFVLNNSLEYVILRNFDEIPNSYSSKHHGDIDLLVEDVNYTNYLVGAKDVYPDQDYRVYYKVEFENGNIPFDFRCIGDNYYDKNWQLAILKNRILDTNGFYKPERIDHFFSLLYHAYVHKHVVAEDYKRYLSDFAFKLGLDYKGESIKDVISLLNSFMVENGYSYTIPLDYSVLFNKKNVQYSSNENLDIPGALVSSSISRTINQSFVTEVFESENYFIKRATYPISENEKCFLEILDSYHYFPKVHEYKRKKHFSDVYITKIEGDSLENLNSIKRFWKKSILLDFYKDCLNILMILAQNNICHRDIRPANILIEQIDGIFRPVLIDFGWSQKINELKSLNPHGLGSKQRWPGTGFSDAYSMSQTLDIYFSKFPFMKSQIEKLQMISPEEYNDINGLIERLETLIQQLQLVNKKSSLKEYVLLFVKKYRIRKFFVYDVKKWITHFQGK